MLALLFFSVELLIVLNKKQHCFVNFDFWQIVMMSVVTWFKLVFKQGMFIMPKLCPCTFKQFPSIYK